MDEEQTSLAERLVQAVRAAGKSRPGDFDYGLQVSPRAATVAMLRELGRECDSNEGAMIPAVQFWALADSIEQAS